MIKAILLILLGMYIGTNIDRTYNYAVPAALKLASEINESAELYCLSKTIYHEASNQPDRGKIAVAQVVINRVKSNKWPDTVCKVVWQQRWSSSCNCLVPMFTWTTDNIPNVVKNKKAWEKSVQAAHAVYRNKAINPVGTATHYHADYVSPYWAKKLKKVTKLGNHIFYSEEA